jgi:hypothetical protein
VDTRSKRRPSDKSLVKGLVPVARQSGSNSTQVIRDRGAGFVGLQVLKSAERGHDPWF